MTQAISSNICLGIYNQTIEEDRPMGDSPIDEYFFWKSLIEDKQELLQPVPDKMFELLALAEIKMTQFLIKKHGLAEDSIPTIALY